MTDYNNQLYIYNYRYKALSIVEQLIIKDT